MRRPAGAAPTGRVDCWAVPRWPAVGQAAGLQPTVAVVRVRLDTLRLVETNVAGLSAACAAIVSVVVAVVTSSVVNWSQARTTVAPEGTDKDGKRMPTVWFDEPSTTSSRSLLVSETEPLVFSSASSLLAAGRASVTVTPVPPAVTETATVSLELSSPSDPVSLSTYCPAVVKEAVVPGAVASANETGPGPLTTLHSAVRTPPAGNRRRSPSRPGRPTPAT